ncbi:MAG: ATP-dependent zinc metalloprotease FtsH [Candidatus Heimdallarchaeota archaeon LC_3]|nr:MAG: ATP-dependent zinc metalloprotease FtsH [Candidatus Heimdallarchaeota archaeon LC_3]
MSVIDIMKNFGEFYEPSDIEETIEEIIGSEEQKSFLHDFFQAINVINTMPEGELPFSITLSALLVGPPGTGKTTLCKAFAKHYKVPIFLVYADSLIGSILGKTLNNIRDVLNAAHTYAKNKTPVVVFFDELDAIASERSSVYEVGEIKRAVVTLLQRMDSILNSKDPIAFLGATNHQHLLDSAVWRRFCYHISFPFPDVKIRKQIINNFLEQLKSSSNFTIQVSEAQIDSVASEEVTGGFTGADIKRGFQIALLRALKDRILDNDKLSLSLQSAGGTKTHIDNEKRMSGREQFDSGQNIQNNKTIKGKSNLKAKKVL